MGPLAHNDVLDAPLNVLKDNVTRITVCNAEPTTYEEGNATYALADVTVDSADFTVADGDTSGRKVTIAAQSNVPVDTGGDATHVALLDVTNTKLLYVTTCTQKTLSATEQVNIPAFKIEFRDPIAV